jgi:DNA-directed RNA polymerase subunit RPC12/RpoP
MTNSMNYRCARCSAPTPWDDDLGKRPICVTCWDKGIDTGTIYRKKKRARTVSFQLSGCNKNELS